MHDQTGVRVSHRIQHAEEEADDLDRREPVRANVFVDSLPVHVLEHEIGLTRSTHARIEQARNTGVLETCEHRSLAAKALLTRAREQREVEELHGRASLEASIGAASEPYGPHAAVTEWALQGVRADDHAGERKLHRHGEES